MQKIACVFSFKKSSWVSCQKIVFNLHKAYQLNPDYVLLNLNYDVLQTQSEIQLTATEIVKANPDTIVIMDHKPHPIRLIECINGLIDSERKKPKLIIHVFGDFTLHYSDWEKLGEILKGWVVKFVVASPRQKILLDKFLTAPLASHICPFPVDEKEFSFTKDLGAKQRKDWSLTEKDVALVFTGRLSQQKRIHTLLKVFAETVEAEKSNNLHLFLYGNPDRIADPFLGKWETEGEYFRKINRIFEKLPEEIKQYIHFMGSVPNSELKAVYHAADYLINLSVHNDEDFGMSVAEAQCCGLPSILTDWGGLAGFERNEIPGATLFVPVRIGTKTKMISQEATKFFISKVLHQTKKTDRARLSASALDALGTKKASVILKAIYDDSGHPFQGFNSFFSKVNFRVGTRSLPYLTEAKTVSNFYREIYSAYVRNH